MVIMTMKATHRLPASSTVSWYFTHLETKYFTYIETKYFFSPLAKYFTLNNIFHPRDETTVNMMEHDDEELTERPLSTPSPRPDTRSTPAAP